MQLSMSMTAPPYAAQPSFLISKRAEPEMNSGSVCYFFLKSHASGLKSVRVQALACFATH